MEILPGEVTQTKNKVQKKFNFDEGQLKTVLEYAMSVSRQRPRKQKKEYTEEDKQIMRDRMSKLREIR